MIESRAVLGYKDSVKVSEKVFRTEKASDTGGGAPEAELDILSTSNFRICRILTNLETSWGKDKLEDESEKRISQTDHNTDAPHSWSK